MDINQTQNKTFRTCEVMQYFSHYDTDFNGLIERIEKMEHLKTYCAVVHDKDKKSDGSPKDPHFHVVLTFSSPKGLPTIAKELNVEPQYVNKIKTTTKSAQLYLVHHNDPRKFQYPATDVRANFDYVNLIDDTPKRINLDAVLGQIDAGTIKPYNLCESVDIATYSKHKVVFDRAFRYYQEKHKGVDREMECMYICGGSGTGKTTYAKMVAAQKGYRCYVSAGGKNPLDDYAGEECIILDDIRGSVFPLADFLKLTDNNTDSLVGCRYYNKSIAYCKLLICTSVQSLQTLYDGVTCDHKEPLKQLYRRFQGGIIEMEDSSMTFYAPEGEGIKPVLKTKNPVKAMFDPVEAKKNVEALVKALGLEIIADDDFIPVSAQEPLPFD